jgi:hypothetical protein
MLSEFTHGQSEYTWRMAAIVFGNLSSITGDCKSDSGHPCCPAPGMAIYWMKGMRGKS